MDASAKGRGCALPKSLTAAWVLCTASVRAGASAGIMVLLVQVQPQMARAGGACVSMHSRFGPAFGPPFRPGSAGTCQHTQQAGGQAGAVLVLTTYGSVAYTECCDATALH